MVHLKHHKGLTRGGPTLVITLTILTIQTPCYIHTLAMFRRAQTSKVFEPRSVELIGCPSRVVSTPHRNLKSRMSDLYECSECFRGNVLKQETGSL